MTRRNPRLRALPVALSAWLIAALAALPPSAAAEALQPTPCPDRVPVECGRLTVPLHPAGTPGADAERKFDLFVERLGSTRPTRNAVLALAGGPGEGATPLAGSWASTIGDAIDGTDLVVFDQRGTGRSGPLTCPPGSDVDPLTVCAPALGQDAPLYATARSVDDIEAVRRALGIEKLTILGVSYGTKVAVEYALAHPDRVSRLILDSPIAPGGPDPFRADSMRAAARVLRETCASGRCASITRSPDRDLGSLVRRMAGRPLRGTLIGPGGKPTTASVTSGDLLSVLLLGDLTPFVRSHLVGAVRAALGGDAAPLVRLTATLLRGASLPATPPDNRFSVGAFAATTCSDISFPWAATGSEGRIAEAASAAARLGAGRLGLFDAAAASASPLLHCAYWPAAGPRARGPVRALRVPTLVLSGTHDLRTPTENALDLRSILPRLTIVRVPVGHSVRTNDGSGCAVRQIRRFLAGLSVKAACPSAFTLPDAVAPPPRDIGAVPAIPHMPRTLSRVVRATAITAQDALRYSDLNAGHQFGGLRGGSVTPSSRGRVKLREAEAIEGIRVSGTINLRQARWTLTARDANGARVGVTKVRGRGWSATAGWRTWRKLDLD